MEERRDANAVAPRRLSPRARLLDAALELFGTAGYEATSIGALCREAKVSTRDFYRHVGHGHLQSRGGIPSRSSARSGWRAS